MKKYLLERQNPSTYREFEFEGMILEFDDDQFHSSSEAVITSEDIYLLNEEKLDKEQVSNLLWNGHEYTFSYHERDLRYIPPTSIWKIKTGDAYWWYDPIKNKVESDYWDDVSVDHERRNSGLAFITKKEACVEQRYTKIKRTLLKMGGRLNFKPNKDNWIMQYDSINDGVYNVSFIEHFSQDVFFDTSKELRDAIKEIGEENIIKYWFRVEKE